MHGNLVSGAGRFGKFAARLLKLGEELNLTENIGYFFVERDDVLAPEHPAIADLLEIGEHLCEDGVAVMLELVVQTAESCIDRIFWYLADVTILSSVMA